MLEIELRSTRGSRKSVATLKVDRDYSLGSGDSNDVVFEGQQVLERHALLHCRNDSVAIRPEPGAAVAVNGVPIQAETVLADGDWLKLGEVVVQVRLHDEAGNRPAPAVPEPGVQETVTIGRLPQCDVQIDSPLVSRTHARVRFGPGPTLLEDLGSTNGTFVNGRPILGTTELKPGDRIAIATYAFEFTGSELRLLDGAGEIRVEVDRLAKEVKDRGSGAPRRLLDDISLAVEPGEFVGIFGTSGSGKSTLLDALNGRRPASGGTVRYNGSDLYSTLDLFRSAIGYVPQQDIVHRKITVANALSYTAQLRLPRQTTGEEIKAQVARVLAQVGLAEKAAMAVDTPEPLSGGQLKRVSLGVELVANPNILFLDEVTSGLDAGTDKRMMQLFGELARHYGKTVVCVTHTLENIDACSLIILLHRGKLVYFGPPEAACDYFKIAKLSEVYDLLETRPVEEWVEVYRSSPLWVRYVGERLRPDEQRALPRIQEASGRHKGWLDLRQSLTLLRRNLDILFSDKKNLAILFAQAPIIGLIVGLVFQNDSQVLAEQVAGRTQMLFILVLSAIWFGCLNSAREVVKELPIYLRERSVNLGIVPYVASKLVPLAVLSLLQCLMLLGAVSALTDLPGSFPDRLAALFLSALAATAMGLTVSTLVSTNDKAVAMIPILLIPQVILSGAVVQLGEITEWFAKFTTISFWGFDAMKTTLDEASRAATNHLGQPLVSVEGEYLSDLGMVSILAAAFVVTACLGLLLKDR